MIVHVVGARPQFMKLKAVHAALREMGVRQLVIHTGQHYDVELSEVFFRELNMPEPDINLGIGSGPHHWQVAKMLEALGNVLQSLEAGVVVLYGDTNSTLAGALAAEMVRVRSVHVEAGMRSWQKFMPEERNRVIVDHLCDRLYVSSHVAMRNLEREGLAERAVFVGDTMLDTLAENMEKVEPPPGKYYVATIHREENTSDKTRLKEILHALSTLPEKVIFPAHPRTRMIIEAWQGNGLVLGDAIEVCAPVGYIDMLSLIRGAKKVITDSGGVQREAYYLRTPCVTIRDATEWVETVECGANTLVPPKAEKIREAVLSESVPREWPPYYGKGDAGRRIARELGGEWNLGSGAS